MLELVPLQMDRYYAISALQLALRRLPALCTTLALELVGGLIIDDLNVVITNYPLIVSFMPTISALSGNLGLQASSNTVRGLGTGEATLTLHWLLSSAVCLLLDETPASALVNKAPPESWLSNQ